MAASWLRAHRVRPGGGAPVKTGQVQGPKWMLDVAGHYARPDVFELRVNRAARSMVVDGAAGEAADFGSTPFGPITARSRRV